MLSEIHIKNFAIIDELRLEFYPGFSVLTGETGAGKSILIDALVLVLGGRASTDMIRSAKDEAEIEAVFRLSKKSPFRKYLEELDLWEDGNLIVRRIISKSGKTKIWINGRSQTQGLLYKLGRNLVDIYGQHEHQGLLEKEQQLNLVDEFGELGPYVSEYGEIYRAYLEIEKEKNELEEAEKRRSEKEDFLKFRRDELKKARLCPKEEQELQEEKKRLKNIELLREATQLGYLELYEKEDSVSAVLAKLVEKLKKASSYDARLGSFAEELKQAQTVVEETGRELGAYLEGLDANPARLEEIELRLATLDSLKRKYKRSIGELIELLEETERELALLENASERREKLSKEFEGVHLELGKKAEGLSGKRKQCAQALEKAIEKELATLGMKGSRFRVNFKELDSFSLNGKDEVEFLISPNLGEELKPLDKIASGGELSRIMLAFKGILARKAEAETMIFDEVDSGIGGATAEVVGRKLKETSRFAQVLCITHLAQIARFADHHYRVEKRVEKGRTVSRVILLNDEERVEELARMLAGEKITERTREYAREILSKGS